MNGKTRSSRLNRSVLARFAGGARALGVVDLEGVGEVLRQPLAADAVVPQRPFPLAEQGGEAGIRQVRVLVVLAVQQQERGRTLLSLDGSCEIGRERPRRDRRHDR